MSLWSWTRPPRVSFPALSSTQKKLFIIRGFVVSCIVYIICLTVLVLFALFLDLSLGVPLTRLFQEAGLEDMKWANLPSGAVTAIVAGRFIWIMIQPAPKAPVKIEPQSEPLAWQWLIPTFEPNTRKENTAHGSAFFLSDKEKEHANAKGQGLWLGGGFFHHDQGNLLTIAPPRSGKGAALIIPNLLWHLHDYPKSFVVFDPKGTNACITASYHKRSGREVYIIDPFGIQAEMKVNSDISPAQVNPLDLISLDDEDMMVSEVSELVLLMLPDDPKAEKFWYEKGRNMLEGIILHVLTSTKYENRRSLVTVYDIVQEQNWTELFKDMIQNLSCDEVIFKIASGLTHEYLKTEKTFSNIVAVTLTAINWVKDPRIKKNIAKSTFDPRNLDKGGITVYICLPFDKTETFSIWSRIIVGMCLKFNTKPASYTKAWVYYLLDEFASMGYFPEVKRALAVSSEYNMRLWLFTQDLSQLDRIYTKEGRTEIVSTSSVFQAFNIVDPEIAKYISERLGTTTEQILTRSVSVSTSNSTGSAKTFGKQETSTSYNESVSYTNGETHAQQIFGRSLQDAGEIINNNYDLMITCISKVGNMRLKKFMYFDDPTPYNLPQTQLYSKFFKEHAQLNPNLSDKLLDGQQIAMAK